MVKQLTLLFSLTIGVLASAQGNNPYFAVSPAKFNTDDAEIGVYKNAGDKKLILVSNKEWGIIKRVDANEHYFF